MRGPQISLRLGRPLQENPMSLMEAYRTWRRNTLPASKNDLDWRAGEIIGRMERLQNSLDGLWLEAARRGSPESQRPVLDLLRLVSPRAAVGVAKVRVGSAHDGGYVQLDDLAPLRLGLSFGVCDDDNWDLEMAQKGIPVDQFDHTVDAAPSTHPLLRFHKKKICPVASATGASLPALVADAPGDRPGVILKMDIEGDEWIVLESASEADLSKIAQFVCEFHGFSRLHETGFYCRALRVFEKLARVFAPVHVHGNNHGRIANIHNVVVPDVLEITFANRRLYTFADSDEIFPTPLDAPCDPGQADIFLGRFQF